MVTKLIKNEFIDPKRKFMPILGLIFAISVLILLSFRSSTIPTESILVVMVTLVIMGFGVAIVVLSFMAFIDLLYTSLYNKNGYRLFTLPVKTWEIITAKVIVFLLWNLIIGLFALVSFFVIGLVTMHGTDVMVIIRSFFSYFFSQVELRVFMVLLLDVITSNLSTIALFFFVGSVVNSTYVQNNRGLKMFIFYLIATVVMGQLYGLVNDYNNFVFDFNVNESFIHGMESFNPLTDGWEVMFNISTNIQGLQSTALMSVLYAIVSALLFMGTAWMWDHKLEIID